MKPGEMLGNMLILATNAHAGQYDKGGKPYILHCLKTFHYIKSEDEELQCIAIGHDLLEDTPISCDDLEEHGMTMRVIYGIRALTKSPNMSYDDYKKKVFANRDAMIVKMADLRHNSDIRRLKGVNEKDIRRIEKYHIFYNELKERLNA